VKTIRPGAAQTFGAELLGRFENEARIASQLRHPNTVRLFDFGRMGSGELYLVTELLHGETLEERLGRGRIEPKRVVQLLVEVAGALDEAHTKGIVHRDLKPRNLFLDRVGDREMIKILDFGLAKTAGLPAHTAVGVAVGSPSYMSPEQAMGKVATPRSDLYSLGVTAFEMLAGRPPFDASNVAALMLKHRHDPPPRFTDLKPPLEVPAPLEELVRALLAKDPADRPASAAELAQRLSAIEAEIGRPGSAGAIGPTAARGDSLVGAVLHGYRLESLLGAGVASEVYAAKHEVLGREAAIKVLTDLGLRTQSSHKRLQREAKILAQLMHPHVVQVLDFAISPEGVPFLILERVQGRNLRQLLGEAGPLTPTRAARIVRQICGALSLAHGKGVIHRDLKPANLMVLDGQDRDVIKVLDFGLARMIDPEGERTKLTHLNAIVGSPAYMAPEQIAAPSAAGPAADLYALGCTLYALLTGHPPFRGSVAEVLELQQNARPPAAPPSAGLERLVAWLLEKRPADRPADAAAVIAELDRLGLAGEVPPPRAPPAPEASITAPLLPPATEPMAAIPAAAGPKRFALVTAGVALVLAGATVGAWYTRPEPRPPPAAAPVPAVEAMPAAPRAVAPAPAAVPKDGPEQTASSPPRTARAAKPPSPEPRPIAAPAPTPPIAPAAELKVVKAKLDRLADLLSDRAGSLPAATTQALEQRYLDLAGHLSPTTPPAQLDSMLREAEALEREIRSAPAAP
jgi:serine/threonine-protein kinase